MCGSPLSSSTATALRPEAARLCLHVAPPPETHSPTRASGDHVRLS